MLKNPTEIKTTAIDLEFLPVDTNEDSGVRQSSSILFFFVDFDERGARSAQSGVRIATNAHRFMALTSYDANHKEQHTNITKIVSLEKG